MDSLVIIIAIMSFALMIVFLRYLKKRESLSDSLSDSANSFHASLPTESVVRHFNLKGIQCETEFTPAVKGRSARPARLRIRVFVPLSSALFLSPETSFDRRLKRWGFSDDPVIGDQVEDRLLHIVAHDPARAVAFLRQESIKSLLLSLFRHPGIAWIQFRPQFSELYFSDFNPQGSDFENFVGEQSQSMIEIAMAAQSAFGQYLNAEAIRFSSRFDFFDTRNYTVLSALFLLSPFAGALASASIQATTVYWSEAIVFFGLPMLLLFLLSILFLRSSIRKIEFPAKAFIRLILILLWAFVANGVLFLNYANSKFDHNEGEVFNSRVMSKYFVKNKNSRAFKVVISPAPKSTLFTSSDYTFSVSLSAYNRAVPMRSLVTTKIHPGFFSIPWHDGFHIE
jgi:hypothetical protein